MPDERDYLGSLADYWNARIEDWTYSDHGSLAERFGVDGYYVRIGPTPRSRACAAASTCATASTAASRSTRWSAWSFSTSFDSACAAPTDPRIRNTLKVAEAMLAVHTPLGIAYHRYNEDGYGEHDDGSPFDGTGVGRAWPLLTGERGHYDVMLGHRSRCRGSRPWCA